VTFHARTVHPVANVYPPGSQKIEPVVKVVGRHSRDSLGTVAEELDLGFMEIAD
jgi:hypothetical protein